MMATAIIRGAFFMREATSQTGELLAEYAMKLLLKECLMMKVSMKDGSVQDLKIEDEAGRGAFRHTAAPHSGPGSQAAVSGHKMCHWPID